MKKLPEEYKRWVRLSKSVNNKPKWNIRIPTNAVAYVKHYEEATPCGEIKTLNCIRFPFNLSYFVFENIDLDSIRKMMLKDLDGLYNSIEFIIEVWEGKRE